MSLVLARMEHAGIAVDPDVLAELSVNTRRDQGAGGDLQTHRQGSTSTPQAAAVVLFDVGVAHGRKTKRLFHRR